MALVEGDGDGDGEPRSSDAASEAVAGDEVSHGGANWRSRTSLLTPTSVSLNLRFVPAYGPAEDVWNALGDRTRRAILEYLAERPCAVGELADRLPVSRPAVSQHLKVLKTTGLVTDDVVGTRHIYRLNPAGVSALRDQLDTFWNRALAGYEDTIDQPTEDQS